MIARLRLRRSPLWARRHAQLVEALTGQLHAQPEPPPPRYGSREPVYPPIPPPLPPRDRWVRDPTWPADPAWRAAATARLGFCVYRPSPERVLQVGARITLTNTEVPDAG